MTDFERDILDSVVVERFEREVVEQPFVQEINATYRELQGILPDMPTKLKVVFDERDNYGETGVDGFSVNDDTIGICIQPGVDDRTEQFAKIRPLVFHECYHIRQGFHYAAGAVSALDAAIYEGCATIFEREYANSEPKWGNYVAEGDKTLQRWYEEMKDITAEQFFEPTGETWKKWAFYDEETQESWRVYKVGTWLVDALLKEGQLSIVDLCMKSADEIREMVDV